MRNWYRELRPVVDLGLGRSFDAGIDFAEQGPGPLPPPPGMFSGWGRPIPLAAALAAQRGQVFNDDRHRLYRLSVRGQTQPLYIGMTKRGVAGRLRAHLTGVRGGSARLRQALQALAALHGMPWVMSNVEVRIAHIDGVGPHVDMNLLHQYELNLQRTERPVVWDPNTWSFDDFVDFEEMP